MLAVKLIAFPEQTGVLLPAVAVGAVLTVTLTVEVVAHPFAVTVTV